jgi:hypothetical protein
LANCGGNRGNRGVSARSKPPSVFGSRVESGKWPFWIQLSASAEFVSQMHWKYALSFGAFGVPLDCFLSRVICWHLRLEDFF